MAEPRCKKCDRLLEDEVALAFDLEKITRNSDEMWTTEKVNGIFSGHLCMDCLP